MASMSPLAGRLSQIFSPRNCIFGSTLIFSFGAFVTSRAVDLPQFLMGRALTGVGAAGILTLSIILVIELTSKRRRGLFIGLVNTGYTSGVSLGAVIAGALLIPMGWVSCACTYPWTYAKLLTASPFLDAIASSTRSWSMHIFQHSQDLHNQHS